MEEKKYINRKKTCAKAAGLRSAFLLDAKNGSALITNRKKGREAIDKLIQKGYVTELRKNKDFSIDLSEKGTYQLMGSRVKLMPDKNNPGKMIEARVATDDPVYNPAGRGSRRPYALKPGEDQIRRKDVLEQIYFGRTFADNIHIQLIYSIMDVNKILAKYASSIVSVLNNLSRTEGTDFMNIISTNVPFADWAAGKEQYKANKAFFNFVGCPQLAYFGSAFYEIDPSKKRDSKDYCIKRSDSDIYHIVAMMGAMRQFCVHGTVKQSGSESHSWAYALSKVDREFLNTMNGIYEKSVNRVNKNFVSTNQVNLQILYEAMKMQPRDKPQLVKSYYEYMILKPQKNLGLSIKKLRECLIALPQAKQIRERMKVTGKNRFDRHKFNLLADYLLYHHYTYFAPLRRDDLIDTLRSLLISGESEEKDRIYQQEAEYLWEQFGATLVNIILPQMDGDTLKMLKENDISGFDESVLPGIRLKTLSENDAGDLRSRNSDYFCKLIYLMTLFLDGKEINDLLTTLINKFDNIAYFYEVMKERSMERRFKSEYEMFSVSDRTAKNLRYINSFARMQKPTANASQTMFREAIHLLGTDMSDSEIDRSVTEVFGWDPDNNTKKTVASHDVRNFISNNVIESDRFLYLVRYVDPKHVRKLANNEHLVRFVLSGIPETQLDRYCESCGRKDLPNKEEKIRFLTGIITKMSYQQFLGVKNDDTKTSSREQEEKSRFTAMLSLYLTVLYLAVKNLVYVNSRYVIGFHCCERDTYLYGFELTGESSRDDADTALRKEFKSGKYRELTRYFIVEDRHYIKKHPRECITTDMKCIEGEKMIKEFRNMVAHMDAVRLADEYIGELETVTSYYALYHYLIQSILQNKFGENAQGTVKGYFDYIRTEHKYNLNFVKALCTPFGYNVARFKALSIENLFDRNRPDSMPKKKESAEKSK